MGPHDAAHQLARANEQTNLMSAEGDTFPPGLDPDRGLHPQYEPHRVDIHLLFVIKVILIEHGEQGAQLKMVFCLDRHETLQWFRWLHAIVVSMGGEDSEIAP